MYTNQLRVRGYLIDSLQNNIADVLAIFPVRRLIYYKKKTHRNVNICSDLPYRRSKSVHISHCIPGFPAVLSSTFCKTSTRFPCCVFGTLLKQTPRFKQNKWTLGAARTGMPTRRVRNVIKRFQRRSELQANVGFLIGTFRNDFINRIFVDSVFHAGHSNYFFG